MAGSDLQDGGGTIQTLKSSLHVSALLLYDAYSSLIKMDVIFPVSCDISSLLSLFLAHVNVEKERLLESCEIGHVREKG